MDNKLNEKQVSNYSEKVATKLSTSFFSTKKQISGQDILSFCAIKQVNLFILKELFQKWNSEFEKLENPYFDYQHPEIKEATNNFKNIISRHILVRQELFNPLLIKAISNTLMLICSPYHFYLNELEIMSQQKTTSLAKLKEMKKFTKINIPILDGLISNLEKTIADETNSDASEILDEVIESLTSEPEDMDPYIAAFSNYVSLNIDDIYLDMEDAQTDVELAQESTLNESLASKNQMSVADMHQQKKIENLSKGITLNQRFMFVNVLFDGNVTKFNNAVLQMDALTNFAEAKRYLNTHFGHWNYSSDEVEEFIGVLERRFS